MARWEIMDELRKVQNTIAEHYREWAGMIGTCWERKDWNEKKRRESRLLAML